MNLTVDEITKSITGRHSLYECDTEELKRLINQYPFFGPAKLLLAKKLKEDKSPQLDEHIRKTSLYFQNPVWFDHVMNETGIVTNDGPGSEGKTEPVDIAVDTETSTVAETDVPFREDMEITTVGTKDTVDIADPETPTFAKTDVPAREDKEITTPAETEDTVDTVDPENADETGPDLPAFKFEPLADPANSELTFEPYHTIDYFASQGIQAKEEEKPQDKFGKQLKSFTEWLKILKRTSVSEIAGAVSPAEEQKVEQMAETSINDREVVTEAMAEVWEKQGNALKATEVYRKLSLLNPSKSSYFAAKIEQLKHL